MFENHKSDIRPQMKETVGLVTTDGHFNLPRELMWVYMHQHTHFITPEGKMRLN